MRKPEHEPTAVETRPPVSRSDDTVDIEADTVEEAMARVAASLGEEAQIIDARKVVSGGIAGLFAKERVVLTARRRPAGLSSILDQMSRDVDAAETEFGVMLRRRLAAGNDLRHDESLHPHHEMPAETTGVAEAIGTILAADAEGYSLTPIEPAPFETAPIAAAPVADGPIETEPMATSPFASPPAAQPASAAWAPAAAPVARHRPPERVAQEPAERRHPAPIPAPPGAGNVDWGRTALVRLGVPERVIAAVATIDCDDDLTWITGVADAVAPLCGGPVSDDNVVVGTGAAPVGEVLGLDRIEPSGIAPYQGGFYTTAAGSYDEQKWLDFVLAGRPLHVVIDDARTWGDLLVADPFMVSWVEPAGVAPALHLATTLGARLGFCPSTAATGGLVRATPVDVALAVRQLLRRR